MGRFTQTAKWYLKHYGTIIIVSACHSERKDESNSKCTTVAFWCKPSRANPRSERPVPHWPSEPGHLPGTSRRNTENHLVYLRNKHAIQRGRKMDQPISIRRREIRWHVRPPHGISHVGVKPPWMELLQAWDISPLGSYLHIVWTKGNSHYTSLHSSATSSFPYFNLPAMQLRFVQLQSFLNGLDLQKFDVGKTLWLAKFVCQDGDPVDCAAWLEMLLHFFRRAAVVHLQIQLKGIINNGNFEMLGITGMKIWKALLSQRLFLDISREPWT